MSRKFKNELILSPKMEKCKHQSRSWCQPQEVPSIQWHPHLVSVRSHSPLAIHLHLDDDFADSHSHIHPGWRKKTKATIPGKKNIYDSRIPRVWYHDLPDSSENMFQKTKASPTDCPFVAFAWKTSLQLKRFQANTSGWSLKNNLFVAFNINSTLLQSSEI